MVMWIMDELIIIWIMDYKGGLLLFGVQMTYNLKQTG
jgi:hypothetical protein